MPRRRSGPTSRDCARPALRDRVPQRAHRAERHDPARRLQHRPLRERRDPDPVPQHRRDGREQGNSATIGIENHTGTDALRFAFNQTLLAPSAAVTSIRYTARLRRPHTRSRATSATRKPAGRQRDRDDRGDADHAGNDRLNGFYSFPSVPEGTYDARSRPLDAARGRRLVVSGPTTLDFTLPPRTDAFGYTCELEEAAFEQADTVVHHRRRRGHHDRPPVPVHVLRRDL